MAYDLHGPPFLTHSAEGTRGPPGAHQRITFPLQGFDLGHRVPTRRPSRNALMTAKMVPMARDISNAFRVRLLGASELRLALPLAQLLYPSLTEDAWVAYASSQSGSGAAPPRRLLAAYNPSGYLHGLCTLSEGFDPRCGQILDVKDLVVTSFLNTKSVAHALLEGIEAAARKGNYRAIRVHLADGNLPQRQALADMLNSGGHVRIAACYTKPLPQPLRPILSP